MKRFLSSILLSGAFALSLAAQTPSERAESPRAQEEGAGLAAHPSLQAAYSHHELILIYLDQHDYDEVMPEYEKLLGLNLEGPLERKLVEGTWVLIGVLRQQGQYELAHEMIDAALGRIRIDDNRFDMLILKAKTFKDEGRIEEAIDTHRRAQQLRPIEEE